MGIWRIDGEIMRVPSSPLANEARLEQILESDISILGLDVVLVIGRQVATSFGKRVDLLAVDGQGTLYVMELKRDKTPRDVVAQALDYGSWVSGLTPDAIAAIYQKYRPGRSLEEAFLERFGTSVPDELNGAHQLIIVASMLDASTERIVSYLSAYGVPLNVVFFSYFQDGSHEYLARSWLIDLVEAETRTRAVHVDRARAQKVTGTWNGQDFYVSLGEGEHRNWDDCLKYGFVSGGQGRWYSQSLESLFPGARVFVYIPKVGYVGVGTVKETSTPVKDFKVEVNGQLVPILEVRDLKAPKMDEHADDPNLSEYLVRVEWLRTRPREAAILEPGLFANQNTACKLRDETTIQRLTEAFQLADE